MDKQRQGEVARACAIVGWFLVAFLWASFNLWYLFAAYLLLHLVEALTVGVKKGTAAGYSKNDSFLYTFVFGFTWWHYLKS